MWISWGNLKNANCSCKFLSFLTVSLFCFVFSLYYCSGWGYIVAFAKVHTIYQLYHNLNSLPSTLLYPSSSLLWLLENFTGTTFTFMYTHTQFLHYIHQVSWVILKAIFLPWCQWLWPIDYTEGSKFRQCYAELKMWGQYFHQPSGRAK
jgi:hypothetical protein